MSTSASVRWASLSTVAASAATTWNSSPGESAACGRPPGEAGIIPAVSQHQPDPAPGAEPERAFLIAVLSPDMDEEEELGEARELARAAGVELVGELTQRRRLPD